MGLKKMLARKIAARLLVVAAASYARGHEDTLSGCYDARRFAEAVERQMADEMALDGL